MPLMNKYKIVIVTVFISIILTYSCIVDPCKYPEGVKANIGFYKFNGNILKDTLIDSLQVIIINGSNDLYYDGTKTKVKSVSLPLSMINDSSTFIFKFDNTIQDTLVLYYDQYLHMVSHECGFVNFYNILNSKVTNNNIDSLWIRKELVEYGNEENIKIYF